MPNLYETSDFPTALTLLHLRHEIVGVDRSSGRAIFQFDDIPKLQDDLKRLRKGAIKIDPIDFWYSQKRLKHILYDES